MANKSIDLGKKLGEILSVEPIGSDDTHYPDLYLSDVEDPAIADIPDKGECTIHYRVLSRTHREEKDGKGKRYSCSIRLEVTSITPPAKQSKKNGEYGGGLRKAMNGYFKDK